MVKTGLDRLSLCEISPQLGKNPALFCNQTSVNRDFIHIIDVFRSRGIRLNSVFAPQHGFGLTDQDNMVEWQSFEDSRTGLPFISLYGNHRKPTVKMLKGLSSIVADLQDIGSRYYTYLWSLYLCLQSCVETDVLLIVLDRPNPINGIDIEGPGVDSEFFSFVGLADIPIRHGCTMGEILTLIASENGISDNLEIIPMSGWQRDMFWGDTGLPWINPSPNMPSPEASLIYPGGCLIEATNISEGRGTVAPFYQYGAPWIDAYDLAAAMDAERLPGVVFRPCFFQPTSNKYSNEKCQGVFLHITDRSSFRPAITFYNLIRAVKNLFPEKFTWRKPPYEYEYDKLPIDILTGGVRFREAIEEDIGWGKISDLWSENEKNFQKKRQQFLIY